MQKNKTISFLNGSNEYSFQSKQFFSPKNINLSEVSGNWDSGSKKISGLMNTTGNSMMNKLEQINEIEENQKLRVELFKAKRTFNSIESESDHLKDTISRITNKIKKQKTKKHNKENINSEESMVMEIIMQVQHFLKSMEALCQENQKQAEKREEKLKKIQSNQRKGAKVYKQILKTCQEKLQSAEQLLLEVTTKLQQKQKALKTVALKCEEYQRSTKEQTQKYETLQKQKRLLQSDIEVYKAQLEKRNLENCELKTRNFESIEKYQNIFNEYQRLQKKAEWFQKMYEQKRMKVSNIEQQKLKFFEEASRENNKLNTRIQQLEKQHRCEKKKLLDEFDNSKKAYEMQENQLLGELNSNRQAQAREKSQIHQQLENLYELYRLQQERSLYFQNQSKSHQSLINNLQKQIISSNKANQVLSSEIKAQKEKITILEIDKQKIIQQRQEIQDKVVEVEQDMQVVLAQLKVKENLLEELKVSMENNHQQSMGDVEVISEKQESLEYQQLEQQVQREKPQRFKLQDFQYRNSFAIKHGYRAQLL